MVETKIKYKPTIIAFLIFIILLAYFIIFELKLRKKEVEPKERIVQFSISDVEKIDIFKDSKRITIKKNKQDLEWYISSFKNLKAGKSEVEIYLDDINELRYTKIIAEQETNLADYGLNPEKASVKIWFKDKTHQTIYLGDKNPDKSGVYIKTDTSPKIYLVDVYKQHIFNRTVSDFRDRTIFKFDSANINKFVFLLDKKEYSATYLTNEKKWMVTKPEKKKMEPDDINPILFNLESLRVYDFVEKDTELKNTGLNNPSKILNLFSRTKEKYTLKIGNKGKKGYYATKGVEPFYLDPYFVEGQLNDWLKKLETVSTNTN